nr:DNA polymerase IV [Ectothiorhodospira sp. 9100]
MSCSIGIAPNKLLAKMASELDKPDGLTHVEPADLVARIWPLQASKINGIGPKSTERLARLDIHTIGDLARAELGLLQEHFGPRYAAWLHDAAHGRDDRPVVTEAERKSVSRETTFERDLHPRQDRAELTGILLALCERVAADLQALGVRGRTVGIKLRYADFRTLTRDHTLREPIDAQADLLVASRECLRRAPLDRPLRLLGVRMSALVPVSLKILESGSRASWPSTSEADGLLPNAPRRRQPWQQEPTLSAPLAVLYWKASRQELVFKARLNHQSGDGYHQYQSSGNTGCEHGQANTGDGVPEIHRVARGREQTTAANQPNRLLRLGAGNTFSPKYGIVRQRDAATEDHQ